MSLPSPPALLDRKPPMDMVRAHCAGEVAEWSKAHAWNACRRATVSRVRIPLSPPLSCSEPEMRLPLGAFFFLFQRRLAETPEPRRLAPGPISVSERLSVSNRANLVRPGSASRRPAFPTGFAGRSTVDSAGVLPVGVAARETHGRHIRGKPCAARRYAGDQGPDGSLTFDDKWPRRH